MFGTVLGMPAPPPPMPVVVPDPAPVVRGAVAPCGAVTWLGADVPLGAGPVPAANAAALDRAIAVASMMVVSFMRSVPSFWTRG